MVTIVLEVLQLKIKVNTINKQGDYKNTCSSSEFLRLRSMDQAIRTMVLKTHLHHQNYLRLNCKDQLPLSQLEYIKQILSLSRRLSIDTKHYASSTRFTLASSASVTAVHIPDITTQRHSPQRESTDLSVRSPSAAAILSRSNTTAPLQQVVNLGFNNATSRLNNTN